MGERTERAWMNKEKREEAMKDQAIQPQNEVVPDAKKIAVIVARQG